MNKKSIYLSPSNQRSNIGAYQNTNECEQCTLIAQSAKVYLEQNFNCIVTIANRTDSAAQRAATANSVNADVYLAIHTNASINTTVQGTETFYHSNDENGKNLALLLLNRIGNLTGIMRRSIPNNTLAELNTPKCTRAYLEVDFHSNSERALWITKNTNVIGITIAETIAEFLNIDKIEPNDTDSIIEIPSSTNYDKNWILNNIETIFNVIADNISSSNNSDGLYHVQVGAYSSSENAEKALAKVKAAGFNAFIKKD